MLAVRAEDLAIPLRTGATGQVRTGLVVAGTPRIGTGETIVWFAPVAVTEAKVSRNGAVQAAGRACDHVSLGHLEGFLDELAGTPGVIDQIAAGTRTRGRTTDRQHRSMSMAATIRAVLLMTLLPRADYRQVLDYLFGQLARIPWQVRFTTPSPTTLAVWRHAIGPKPLAELRDRVLRGVWAAHAGGAWAAFEAGGLLVGAIDGTTTRMSDTPANRRFYGTVGGRDAGPFPQIRHLHVTDAATRSAFAAVGGPSTGDKAEAEQGLLDTTLERFAHLFTPDRLWLLDRNYPGADRIARVLATGTHVLIRLKSDIHLERIGGFLPDGSWLARIRGTNGVEVTVRVIEYVVELDGQVCPDSYCLITDLHDHERWPAPMLAALYPRRWDGSETSLREDKSTIRAAGPSTGAILRSRTPDGIEQEHAAWITACETIRAMIRAATGLAEPIARGPRTGHPIQARDLSFTRAWNVLLAHLAPIPGPRQDALRAVAAVRVRTDRHRHRPRKTKAAPTFGHLREAPTRSSTTVLHHYGNGPTTPTDTTTPDPDTTPAPTPRPTPRPKPPAQTDTKPAARQQKRPTRNTGRRRPRPPGPPHPRTHRPRTLKPAANLIPRP